MKAARILIIDDDAAVRELVAGHLHEAKFETVEAADGYEAIAQFRRCRPDLVLLDIVMPGPDGIAVCRHIRRESQVPIIFLTGQRDAPDVIAGLEAGGDDYIVKPFLPAVLVARIRANLRRTGVYNATDILMYGDLHIHRDTFDVRFRGKKIPFQPKELKLVLFLAEQPQRVFSVDQLYEAIWGDIGGDPRTVMVHISHIRRKLNEHAPGVIRIETLKGVGYRLSPAE